VENQLPWSLDTMFGEDDSCVWRKIGPTSINTLRQFGLNPLKRIRPSVSIRQKTFEAKCHAHFRAKIPFHQ
jgi:hypothetical protein